MTPDCGSRLVVATTAAPSSLPCTAEAIGFHRHFATVALAQSRKVRAWTKRRPFGIQYGCFFSMNGTVAPVPGRGPGGGAFWFPAGGGYQRERWYVSRVLTRLNGYQP